MTGQSTADGYRSIFLRDGWAHQKYLGWRLADDQPGLRILVKKHAVLTRCLCLLTAAGRDELAAAVGRTAGIAALAEVVIHDFDGIFGSAADIADLPHLSFRAADASNQMLNVTTLVVDLTRDPATLLAAMSSDFRRKIKKAEAQGISVDVHEKPSVDLQNEFCDAHARLAVDRHFQPADSAVLQRIFAGNDAVLFVARSGEQAVNYLQVYLAGDAAIFSYGVNPEKENNGAGQFIFWRAMCYLKERGIRWFDFGGVPSTDASDGIFNFKSKFGGTLVPLGQEWVHSGVAFPVARRLAALRRRVLA